MPEIDPCPFCGASDAYTRTYCEDDPTWYYVVCERPCDAQGPPAPDAEAAIAAWNKRARND